MYEYVSTLVVNQLWSVTETFEGKKVICTYILVQ